MAKKKSALERLQEAKPSHVTEIPPGFPGFTTYPGGTMVVSNPREVDAILQLVPAGSLTTLDHIRAHLAAQYSTNMACPVSTAIFINVVARAAEEMAVLGADAITPYWRVVKPDGSLNEKYPGGIEAQKARLEAEGFTVVQRRKRYVVEDYERYLVGL